MEAQTANAVDQLYLRLSQALRDTRRDPFGEPVTVAEIYQELVPYRSVRTEVGFAMNADYEDALLRLLAGENGRVHLEPSSAREAIRRELKSPNPNVGLYREYAGCDVVVEAEALEALEALEARGGGEPHPGPAPESEPEAEPAPQADGDPRPRVSAQFEVVELEAEAEAEAEVQVEGEGETSQIEVVQEAAVERGLRCAYCDSVLPRGRPVRYCPFCGGDQSMQPCGACGEALEPGWSFCIACGESRSEG